MTGDEMERAIAFVLESQASLTVRLDQLTVSHERLEATVERLAEEAAADRTEVRSAVNTMLSFAEAMADNVRRLTDSQIDTNRRVRAVEDRLDSIENN